MTNKELCLKCKELAVWAYMPGAAAYCDYCVPRGCSCNWHPTTEHSEELIEEKDEYGRSYPCCEYLFDENGFDTV